MVSGTATVAHTCWVGIHVPQEVWKRTIEQQVTQLQQSFAGLK